MRNLIGVLMFDVEDARANDRAAGSQSYSKLIKEKNRGIKRTGAEELVGKLLEGSPVVVDVTATANRKMSEIVLKTSSGEEEF